MDRHAPGPQNLRASSSLVPLLSWDLVWSITFKPFQISSGRPAGLEAEQLGGVWSLKPLNGNAIWLDDRFTSPRISPFLPRRTDCLLRTGIGHALHTISHKRDPRLIIDFTVLFPCPGKC